MGTTLSTKSAFLCGSILSMIAPSGVYAQVIPPPVKLTVDENGIDMTTGSGQYGVGTIVYSTPEISVGSDKGLTFSETYIQSSNDFIHPYKVYMTGTAVVVGSQSYKFTGSAGAYTSALADGSTLSSDASGYTFCSPDGTIIRFDTLPSASYRFYLNEYGFTGLASYLIKPDGEKLTFFYRSATLGTGSNPSRFYRLQSVISSTGYQAKFYYPSDIFDSSNSGAWSGYNKVSLINNAVDYCDPAADACTGLTQTWPSLSISWVDGSKVVTDNLGNSTRYTSTSAFGWQIQHPGSTSPDLIYGSDGTAAIVDGGYNWSRNVVRGGVTYTYSLRYTDTTFTMTLSGPNGTIRTTTGDSVKDVLLSKTDYVDTSASNTTYYQYDTYGRLTYVISPEGSVVSGTPSSGYIKYTYDGRGNVTERRKVSKTPGTPSDIVEAASYPSSCTYALTCNKPTWTRDALNNETDYTYDDTHHGGVLTVTAPPSATGGIRPQVRYIYTPFYAWYKNSAGSVIQAMSPIYLLTGTSACQTTASCSGTSDETTSTIGYQTGSSGVSSNLLRASISTGSGASPNMTSRSVTYDNVGNVVTNVDALGNVSYHFYDSIRRPTGSISPDPDGSGIMKRRATRLTYNANGQLITMEEGTAGGTTAGDLAAMTVLRKIDTVYDGNFRKVQDTLTAGSTPYSVIQYSYDAVDRLECTAQRMNPAIFTSLPSSACTLGAMGTFGPDRISRNVYDISGQLLKIQNGYGTSQQRDELTTGYSADGKTATVTDAKGNMTAYAYDGFDRLWRTCFQSSAATCAGSPSDYEQLTYDANSRVAAWRRRDNVSYTMGYDDLNRLTGRFYAGGGNNANVTYTYDLLGRVLTAARNNSAYGSHVAFGYDALGRTTSKTSWYGATAISPKSLGYAYDAAGRRTQMNWYNNATSSDYGYVTYDYLATGEMTAIRESGATSGVGVLASFSYDDLGRRTLTYRGNATGTSYTYDALSRLICLGQNLAGGDTIDCTPTASGNDQSTTFVYSPASQIVQRTSANDTYAWAQSYNVSRSYTSNGLNQYSAITSSATINPIYDARGNLTNAGDKTYSYSTDNELTGANSDRFDYDAFDRLIYSSNTHTRFDYDGDNLVAEYDDSGNLLRRYVHGPGTDEPLVWYEGAGTSDKRWLHADERGSIIAVTNSAGNSIATNSYDSWGIPQSTNLGRFQYTGQAWLPEIGMYYYKARIYSPTLGRFLQTDPIGYADGLNWYNYVHNDPLNRRDPTGEADGSPGLGDEIVVNAQLAKLSIFSGSSLPNISGASALNSAARAGDIVVTAVKNHPYIATGVALGVGVLVCPECDIVEIVVAARRASLFTRIFRKIFGRSSCFAAGTLVQTDHGLRAIETIKLGDMVLSRDEKTGRTGYRRVTAVKVPTQDELYTVELDIPAGLEAPHQADFRATATHPWRTVAGSWVKTADLRNGMQLVRADGAPAIVEWVRNMHKQAPTYNLTVEGYHTYFVGKDHVWVHNACDPPSLKGLHSDAANESGLARMTREFWDKRSTQDIIDSLAPGKDEPLIVDDEGVIWNGNQRVQLLRDRGYPVDTLPRVPR